MVPGVMIYVFVCLHFDWWNTDCVLIFFLSLAMLESWEYENKTSFKNCTVYFSNIWSECIFWCLNKTPVFVKYISGICFLLQYCLMCALETKIISIKNLVISFQYLPVSEYSPLMGILAFILFRQSAASIYRSCYLVS